MTNHEITQALRVTAGAMMSLSCRLADASIRAIDNGNFAAILAARHTTTAAYQLVAALDSHKNDFAFDDFLTDAVNSLLLAKSYAAATGVTATASDKHSAADDIEAAIRVITDVRAAL